jgi:hypothetical protein
MLNADVVRATLRTRSIGNEFLLVKFPLPLRGTWGVFLPPAEFFTMRDAIERLKAHVGEPDGIAQWQAALSVLGTTTVAVEQRHIQSLTTIVREGIDYFRHVSPQSERTPE